MVVHLDCFSVWRSFRPPLNAPLPPIVLLLISCILSPSLSQLLPPNHSRDLAWVSSASAALDHLYTLQVPSTPSNQT